jgi:hypothetical protein
MRSPVFFVFTFSCKHPSLVFFLRKGANILTTAFNPGFYSAEREIEHRNTNERLFEMWKLFLANLGLEEIVTGSWAKNILSAGRTLRYTLVSGRRRRQLQTALQLRSAGSSHTWRHCGHRCGRRETFWNVTLWIRSSLNRTKIRLRSGSLYRVIHSTSTVLKETVGVWSFRAENLNDFFSDSSPFPSDDFLHWCHSALLWSFEGYSVLRVQGSWGSWSTVNRLG